MRLGLMIFLVATSALAQAPLPCGEAKRVRCVRSTGGAYRCAPGVYEPLPFGRVVTQRPSAASVTPDGGTKRSLDELVFDASGLSRLEQQYVLEEYARRQGGGRRTEFTTSNRRSGEVTREVRISGIAVQRFRQWVEGGCQPPGQFLRYLFKGGGGTRASGERIQVNPEFRKRLLGGASESKWAPGGAMERRSREVWKGRRRPDRDER